MNHIANNRILNAMLLSPDLTISAVSNRQSELILLLNTINSRLSNAPDGTLRMLSVATPINIITEQILMTEQEHT